MFDRQWCNCFPTDLGDGENPTVNEQSTDGGDYLSAQETKVDMYPQSVDIDTVPGEPTLNSESAELGGAGGGVWDQYNGKWWGFLTIALFLSLSHLHSIMLVLVHVSSGLSLHFVCIWSVCLLLSVFLEQNEGIFSMPRVVYIVHVPRVGYHSLHLNTSPIK